MDNAVKALEIAGGVLIAILILSLFVFMFNQVSYNQAMQNQNEETKKIEEFNKKYEAYNKNILYGADVISVINMAISNNIEETAGGQYDTSDPYFIEVSFELNTDLTTKIEAVDREGNKIENIRYDDFDTKLEADHGPYRISSEDDVEKIELIMPTEDGTVIEYNKRTGTTLIAKGAYEEFINRIFTCDSIGYNTVTGRVNEVVFTEVNTTEDAEVEAP